MTPTDDPAGPPVRPRTEPLRTFQIPFAVALLAGVLLQPAAPAQVPGGWAVAAAVRAYPSPGGLFLLHPLPLFAPVQVTGLPFELTGVGWPNTGAMSVVRRPWDEVLIVGVMADCGLPAEVHFLRLNGTALGSDTRVTLGASLPCSGLPGGPPARVGQMALIGDGSVLAATGLTVPLPALAATAFAIVSENGAIVPVPVSTAAGPVLACRTVALDAASTTMYFALPTATTLPFAAIHAAAFPFGGLAAPVTSVPGTPDSILVEASGNLLLATSSGLFRVFPPTGAVTPLWTATAVTAVVPDPVTGDLLFLAGVPFPGQIVLVRLAPSGASTIVLSGPAMPPWTYLGMDLSPSIERIGAGSPPGLYAFQSAPNPGGLPFPGNAAFSLTHTAFACSPGFLGVSLGRLSPPLNVGGALIHVDPGTLVILAPYPCGVATNTFPLPIPANPALSGATFFVQTAHVSWTSVGANASDALRVTIL